MTWMKIRVNVYTKVLLRKLVKWALANAVSNLRSRPHWILVSVMTIMLALVVLYKNNSEVFNQMIWLGLPAFALTYYLSKVVRSSGLYKSRGYRNVAGIIAIFIGILGLIGWVAYKAVISLYSLTVETVGCGCSGRYHLRSWLSSSYG